MSTLYARETALRHDGLIGVTESINCKEVTMRKKIFFPVIVTLLALGIAATANATVNSIWTSAWTLNRPDGMFLEIFIRVEATGSVPNSIKRIRVVAPDGTAFDTRDGFPMRYFPPDNGFDLYVAESEFVSGIPSGNYKIKVWDGSDGLLVSDRVNVKALPVPTNVYPGPGDTVSTTATFSWDPVPGAKRYRVRIGKCWDDTCIGYPPWIQLYTNETSLKIPKWVLGGGEQYLFRLDAYDAYDDPQNKSTTDYINFFTQP